VSSEYFIYHRNVCVQSHTKFNAVTFCHFLFPLQGIEIKSPFQWPYNRGLSFSCWLRVENFPENGMMGLFSFCTEDGRGCSAMLSKSALVYEVMLFFLLYFGSNQVLHKLEL
jgi:hypothetical protein